MLRRKWLPVVVLVVFVASLGASRAAIGADGVGQREGREAGEPTFVRRAPITNRYMPLSSQRQCIFAGTKDGAEVRITATRLDRTQRIVWEDGKVDAVVSEFRSFEGGELVEVAIDYFAQATDGTVHYLGEDVDNYENGQVADHDGTWRLGRDTQEVGVVMPANPTRDRWFRAEDVPPITAEQDIVTGTGLTVTVPAGTFHDVIKVREILAPTGQVEFKYFAPGQGEIRTESPSENEIIELVNCAA